MNAALVCLPNFPNLSAEEKKYYSFYQKKVLALVCASHLAHLTNPLTL